MKFSIITLGCKVNAYESEAMKELLITEGFIYEEEHINSDIVIINTCSVTNMADAKSRKIIRRVRRENENAILVVAGCSSQNNQELYKEMDIDILIGNEKKSLIVKLIRDYLETHEKYCYLTKERNLPFESMNVLKFTSQTRAFIKIQDGCNNFCSYCIIPYVRGDIRSKDFDSIIEEAKTLVDNGHYELVLTGIHTGSYNYNGKDLVDLIRELSKIEDLKRIRISSIEITELNDKFMNLLKEEVKVCNHLHIPLQSGSDNVLKRMNRKYNKEYFKKEIDEIRSIRPGISITTDIIVGHPYETEEDFQECYEFAKEINFSKIHVFPYSVRNGTVAATMPNQVAECDKKQRAHELLKLSNELEKEYFTKFVGQKVSVLIEENDDSNSYGHTDNYLRVVIEELVPVNNFYNVEIIEIRDLNAIGKIVK